MDLTDPTVYQDAHRNPGPNYVIPDLDLRQAFQRVQFGGSRIPLEVLQAMVAAGVHSTQSWANSFGDTRTVAEARLQSLPEVANNVSTNTAHRLIETGFLMTV